jgi:catechol 2,3-dioxygenase-like lactoylglutathione lyase family enzyme
VAQKRTLAKGEPTLSGGIKEERKMTAITRGIDHIGITVPNLEEASLFFEKALDAVPMYDNIKRGEPPLRGPAVEKQLNLAPDTSLITMRMMKLGNGPGLELFEMQRSDQQRPARPSDLGVQHFAVYVDDIEAAAEKFISAGGELMTGPNATFGPEEGEGNAWLYARTPWGTIVELISHPSPLLLW